VIGHQRRLPDFATRSSIASAKGVIEVGQITEPDIERSVEEFHIPPARLNKLVVTRTKAAEKRALDRSD
jgi:hypothetical protein